MNTFKKEEKLIQKKLIDLLYSQGKSFIKYPLLCIYYKVVGSKYPAQILITVSKKRIKKAVDRNIIKRRIKEAYRIHKNEFYKALLLNNNHIILSVSFIGEKIIKVDEIEIQVMNMINEFKIIFQN